MNTATAKASPKRCWNRRVTVPCDSSRAAISSSATSTSSRGAGMAGTGARLPDARHVVGQPQAAERLALDLGLRARGEGAVGDEERDRLAGLDGDADRVPAGP